MELDPVPIASIATNSVAFHIGTFPKQPKKKKSKKRRSNGAGTPPHPGILDRFSRVMHSISSGEPLDLGPPTPGTLRILVPAYESKEYGTVTNGEWLHRTIHSHDRTLTEWCGLIQEHRRPIFQPSSFYTPTMNPFAYRYEHACVMARIVSKNLRIRRFFRFWLASARKRIMDKRIIGDLDLYTMNPIPDQFRIRVYDVPTRTTYVFHMNTVLRTILSSLTYNSFGIANPQMPKNPYTNVPWTIGQLITIVEQCVQHKLRAHSFLPFLIQIYRESGYDIKNMCIKQASALNIAAARSYFSNHVDPDVVEMYLEVYDDLYALVAEKKGMWLVIKRKLELRNLSKDLQKEWDDIILTYWIFHTFRYVLSPSMKTIDQVDTDLIQLYNKTCDWWSKQPRRSIRKRVSPPLPAVQPGLPSTNETITHI